MTINPVLFPFLVDAIVRADFTADTVVIELAALFRRVDAAGRRATERF